ncbi:MAG: hypothetical protein ABSE48_22710 [Verrucomicrobiota bacterium]
MKQKASIFLGIILLSLILAFSAYTATITWTNTAAGVWGVAANWYPNQVPGPADTVVIPLAATNGAAVDAAYTIQNLILDGGDLNNTGYSYDVLTVNGQINWTNGILGCAITNDGVMTLAGTNGVDYTLAYPLFNSGTFNVVSGNLLINYCGYNYGALYNAQGALLNLQEDASIDISSNQFGLCPPVFSNEGTIRKSGGMGTSYLYPSLINSGTVDVQTGTISFNGGGNLGGTLQSEGNGALVLATNIYNAALTLAGNLTSTNAFLRGAELGGTGIISGVLTWNSGSFDGGFQTPTIGTNGVLVLAGVNGTNYSLDIALDNQGIIKLISGNLLIDDCGSDFGQLNNEAGGLVDFENDVSIESSCGGQLINLGTVRKSGGTGTSDIGAYLNNNAGILDAQTGIIGLTNNYDLAGGTLNFGISSLTSYGQIHVAGSTTLAGTLSINLNDGYYPTNGNAFPLLTYGSETGAFNPLALPSWINWQTNYGPTTFTLSVANLNGRPVVAAAKVPAPGQFSFQFTGNPSGSYSVLATTNLILPLADWTVLGSATLVSSDFFQYVDTHATNYPQRFYKLRAP